MESISREQLKAIERYLDRMYDAIGVDIAFTKHFFDRLNDERNGIPITVEEITGVFTKFFTKYGKKIASVADKAKALQAVITDISNDINVPFALKWDSANNEFDLVTKTVMRKHGFTVGREHRFKVESTTLGGKMLNEEDCPVEPFDTSSKEDLVKLGMWVTKLLSGGTTDPEETFKALSARLLQVGITIPEFEFSFEEAMEDGEGVLEIEAIHAVSEEADAIRGGLFLVIEWELEGDVIEMEASFAHGDDLEEYSEEEEEEGEEDDELTDEEITEIVTKFQTVRAARNFGTLSEEDLKGSEDSYFETLVETVAALIPSILPKDAYYTLANVMLDPQARFILTKLQKSDTFKKWRTKHQGKLCSHKAYMDLMGVLRDKFSIREKEQLERLIDIIAARLPCGDFDGTTEPV